MTCTVVFEVCQQGQRTDKESHVKVEQQRTRALFKASALLIHFRLGWNVLRALREPLDSSEHDPPTLMNIGKLIIDIYKGHTFTASNVNARHTFCIAGRSVRVMCIVLEFWLGQKLCQILQLSEQSLTSESLG